VKALVGLGRAWTKFVSPGVASVAFIESAAAPVAGTSKIEDDDVVRIFFDGLAKPLKRRKIVGDPVEHKAADGAHERIIAAKDQRSAR
jgi:hypothetical protein